MLHSTMAIVEYSHWPLAATMMDCACRLQMVNAAAVVAGEDWAKLAVELDSKSPLEIMDSVSVSEAEIGLLAMWH